jgi:hypothetical protein
MAGYRQDEEVKRHGTTDSGGKTMGFHPRQIVEGSGKRTAAIE